MKHILHKRANRYKGDQVCDSKPDVLLFSNSLTRRIIITLTLEDIKEKIHCECLCKLHNATLRMKHRHILQDENPAHIHACAEYVSDIF